MHTHTWRYLDVLVLCSAPQTWSALSLNIQYILVIYNALGYNVVYMVRYKRGWGERMGAEGRGRERGRKRRGKRRGEEEKREEKGRGGKRQGEKRGEDGSKGKRREEEGREGKRRKEEGREKGKKTALPLSLGMQKVNSNQAKNLRWGRSGKKTMQGYQP